MHRHDCFRPRGYGLFNQCGVNVEGLVVNVHIHRLRAGIRNGPARRDERVRRADDFIARFDIEQQHRDVQRGGAAIETQRVPGVAIAGKVLFKLRHIGPQAERAIVNGFGNDGVQLLAKGPHLRGQIEIRYWLIHIYF